MRAWAQKYFGWIPGFVGWVDRMTKALRTLGIMITFLIALSHWKQCKQTENYRHRLAHYEKP
jgi:hypothetical protein